MSTNANRGMYITMLILIALIVGGITYIGATAHLKNKAAENDSIKYISDNDTISTTVEDDEWSIDDYLSYRNLLILERHCDSMFLTMPEEVIVCILKSKGRDTQLSIPEIVAEYEKNIDFYKGFEKAVKSMNEPVKNNAYGTDSTSTKKD
jgi:hypothetical protein